MGLCDKCRPTRCVVASMNSSWTHVSVHYFVNAVEAVVTGSGRRLGLRLGLCRRDLLIGRPFRPALVLVLTLLLRLRFASIVLAEATVVLRRMGVLEFFDAIDLAALSGHLDLGSAFQLVDDGLDVPSGGIGAVGALVVCNLLHNVKSVTTFD